MINEYPTTCNICSNPVILVSNKEIYGKEYGSGKAYLCTSCRAYVGTHNTGKKNKALGLLANADMRKGKMACHKLFDKQWKYQRKNRGKCYRELAEKLGIDPKDCHFGHFDLKMLIKAYNILK